MGWFNIRVKLPRNASDTAAGLLFDLGSCGLEVEDGLANAATRLTAYFPDNPDRCSVASDFRDRLNTLVAGLTGVRVDVATVPPEDWSATWKAWFKPVFPIPSLAICPPWERVADSDGGVSLVIEPKTAFGTGHHETTRLALRMMHAVLESGNEVLDVGTGSGILSLAAAKLGAGRVMGIDTDALAVENARANRGLNEIAVNVEFRKGTVSDVSGMFDVVVANISSRTLVTLLPALASRLGPRGSLILGGMLVGEEAVMLDALGEAGLQALDVCAENGWLGIRAA